MSDEYKPGWHGSTVNTSGWVDDMDAVSAYPAMAVLSVGMLETESLLLSATSMIYVCDHIAEFEAYASSHPHDGLAKYYHRYGTDEFQDKLRKAVIQLCAMLGILDADSAPENAESPGDTDASNAPESGSSTDGATAPPTT